jgi:SAM-dependent methyltransferase
MARGLENTLRSVMNSIGHLIERVIGHAQKAKVQVGVRGGVQPILSLESVLGTGKIKSLIDVSTERLALPMVPDLKGGSSLDVGEGPPQFLNSFVEKGSRIAVGFEIGGGSRGAQGDASKGYIVRGSATSIPFGGDFFDFVSARLATPFQGDILRVMKEIGRITAPGGQGVLIDYHPYGMYAKKGSNRLRSVESSIRGAEDYYRICRAAGLRVVDLREAFVDENMRSVFGEEYIQAYRSVKGSPLVIYLFFYKPRTRK